MADLDPSQCVITGTTRLYAILGDPIAQVGSPRVFNPLLFRSGADAVLVPLHVAPADLATAFAGIRAMRNLDGLIFTIPHKMAAMALVDAVSATGKLVGAVNVARREKDGRWVADMFDGRGCVRALKDQGDDPAGKSALVVGAGGGGSAVACALAPDPVGYDLVVNCTPLGMNPDDPLPLPADRLAPGTVLVDIVLKPAVTKLLEAGRRRGCRTMNGLAMLRGQSLEVARFFGFG
jgi:shikimate dehydrogenase